MCHWQFAEFAEPGKTSWNLEPWRPGRRRRRDGRPRAAIPAAQKNRSSARRTARQWPRVVDHTLLKPEATDADVAALVAEAAELGRVRGVRIAVDGAPSPGSSAAAASADRHRRGIPVRQAPFGDQGARGRAGRRMRAPTRSTWSSTSAPRYPATSTRCAPTSPRSAPPCPTRSSR